MIEWRFLLLGKYFYENSFTMSFPFARISSAIKSRNPVIWTYSKNLSLGFLPVIISYKVNITWPPSNAGIGNKFMNPNIIDRNAVIPQNDCQLQVAGKILPIAIKPPMLVAPFLVKTYLNCVM